MAQVDLLEQLVVREAAGGTEAELGHAAEARFIQQDQTKAVVHGQGGHGRFRAQAAAPVPLVQHGEARSLLLGHRARGFHPAAAHAVAPAQALGIKVHVHRGIGVDDGQQLVVREVAGGQDNVDRLALILPGRKLIHAHRHVLRPVEDAFLCACALSIRLLERGGAALLLRRQAGRLIRPAAVALPRRGVGVIRLIVDSVLVHGDGDARQGRGAGQGHDRVFRQRRKRRKHGQSKDHPSFELHGCFTSCG